jgi:2-polyprenyl-3-methyl-5-hydroxy-6-metoxy-1,4-benzoquinol methylase
LNPPRHSADRQNPRIASLDDPAALARRTVAVYAPLGWKAELYVRLRLLTAPLIETARYVPARGRILDLGCGHGIFAHILHLGSTEREVIGVDLMADRIAAAVKTMPADGRLRFSVGDARGFPPGPFDVIACIDLLHHMPLAAQEELLRMIADVLPVDGVLVIKDLEKRPRWKYLYHYAQDWVSYRFRPLFFRSREDMTQLLDRLGFSTEIHSLAGGRPYPHVVYIGRWKTAA